MIETETRPLTAEERALLPNRPGVAVRWTAGIGAALSATAITWLLALLVAGIAGWTSTRAERALILVAIAGGLGVYTYVAYRERRTPEGPTLWDDVHAGTAEVSRYDVVDALAVEEFEDEGLSYYLELVDGRVVFLTGQYLYEPVEQGQFPARRVEVVRTAVTATVLRVIALGPPLPPSATRPPFDETEFGTDRIPEDGALLPGPLAQYHGQRT